MTIDTTSQANVKGNALNVHQSASRAGQRLVHIDLARAIMLFLGIPYHVSEAYRLDYQWYVVSGQPSLLLTFVSGSIHSFRMPALFLLSGYFAMLVVGRRGLWSWVTKRITRLLVPLVSTALLLGILEVTLADYFRSGATLRESFHSALVVGPGAWIMHRWFLVVLVIYSGLFAICLAVLRYDSTSRDAFPNVVHSRWLPVFLVLAGLCSAVAGKLVGPIGGEALRFYVVAIVRYAPMFWLGALLGQNAGYLDQLLKVNRWSLLSGAAALLAYLALFVPWGTAILPGANEVVLKRYAFPLIEPVSGWYVSIMFLSLIKNLTERRFPEGLPAPVRLLVDNAMAIYLLHMIAVILATGLLLSVDWPSVVEFLVATFACSLFCAAAVWALAGNGVYELIFNGQRLSR